MKEKIVKRLFNVIPMLFFISIISFLLMHLAPGDPIQAYITPKMSAVDIERVRHNMGLDQPIYIQYFKWLINAVQGNLGYSLINHRPVATVIFDRIPNTILITLTALILSLIIAIPVGLISGYNKNSVLDNVLNVIAYIGISIPSFWFAMMIIYIFSLKLNLLPSIGMRTIGVDTTVDLIKHMIMPVIVLSYYNVCVFTRYIRSSTIGQLNEDYVLTQYAYGASAKEVLFKHVFKNTLLPIITIFAMSLPQLVTGAFITETIFGWPGMGQLGVTAIFGYDYPVVMGITMISSVVLIIGNLIADILYQVVDPRIKH
ncbi:ABC transporter permease [Asaccharospora irregularis]|uniref:Peptide/nickel transport system permease protein n=1 Tax=Asaccharospora irregularis DSM 2635 TaxID=1121321 RepID=A0A1M5KRD6_9FIRM|nr:ABC transporter permease [Asaccharospora irregularis]SHG55321.1 peptide/nickel transport system permease protein [Asaccharospora irregularis DSM 2635]